MSQIINMPKEVEKAINKLNNCGFDAYVVGGCVRDCILGIEPTDWDITTSALPLNIINCFENYKIIETGLKHGTVTVIIDDMHLEITTYRIDGEYKDNRRPDDVKFTSEIAYDLQRRDFTINAIAYNHKNGIVDLYVGIKDIELSLIKCVGEPDKRFNEDALRILRALRFSSVLNFDIELNTAKSIHKNKNLLTNISSERIAVEFNKLITGINFKNVLTEYKDVIAVFIPEILNIYKWVNTLSVMSNVNNVLNLKLAVMFHDIGKLENEINNEENMDDISHAKRSSDIASKILQNLKYDKETIYVVKNLVLYYSAEIQPTSKNIKRWLNKIGIEMFKLILESKKAHIKAQDNFVPENSYVIEQIEFIMSEVLSEKQCYNLNDLAIKGTDLIEIGLPTGKHIGETLGELLNKVIDEDLKNERDVLLNYVKNVRLGSNLTIVK